MLAYLESHLDKCGTGLPLKPGQGKGFRMIFFLQDVCVLIWYLDGNVLKKTVSQWEDVGLL